MFRRTTRHRLFWAAGALLALLAAPHTLPAQDAPPTVKVTVFNRTTKPIEVALVGPDGKDLGYPFIVRPGRTFRINMKRTLLKLPDSVITRGNASGYKWVARNPGDKQVLKEVPANLPGLVVDPPRATSTLPAGHLGARLAKGQGATGGQNRSDLLRLINQHRRANGQGPLRMDSSLTRAAQEHTDWMKATGTFSQQG